MSFFSCVLYLGRIAEYKLLPSYDKVLLQAFLKIFSELETGCLGLYTAFLLTFFSCLFIEGKIFIFYLEINKFFFSNNPFFQLDNIEQIKSIYF